MIPKHNNKTRKIIKKRDIKVKFEFPKRRRNPLGRLWDLTLVAESLLRNLSILILHPNNPIRKFSPDREFTFQSSTIPCFPHMFKHHYSKMQHLPFLSCVNRKYVVFIQKYSNLFHTFQLCILINSQLSHRENPTSCSYRATKEEMFNGLGRGIAQKIIQIQKTHKCADSIFSW